MHSVHDDLLTITQYLDLLPRRAVGAMSEVFIFLNGRLVRSRIARLGELPNRTRTWPNSSLRARTRLSIAAAASAILMSMSTVGMYFVRAPVFVASGYSLPHKLISASLVLIFCSHSFSGGILPMQGIGE
jgi:hypothetical protein